MLGQSVLAHLRRPVPCPGFDPSVGGRRGCRESGLGQVAVPVRLLRGKAFSRHECLVVPLKSKVQEKQNFMTSLILAQNERWRRGLGMQVERGLVLRGEDLVAKG